VTREVVLFSQLRDGAAKFDDAASGVGAKAEFCECDELEIPTRGASGSCENCCNSEDKERLAEHYLSCR
jgi:hypothetical protein